MRYSSLVLFILSMVIIGCTGKGKKYAKSQQETTKQTIESMKSAPMSMFQATHRAPGYTFTIRADNGERTEIELSTQGLENEYRETYTIEGQVMESVMLDINGDNYKEFYLTILPTDDSGNVDLMVFASNRGKSISQAYVQEPSALRTMNTDKVYVKNGQLFRTFQSEGEKHTYTYEIRPGETSYILEAKRIQ